MELIHRRPTLLNNFVVCVRGEGGIVAARDGTCCIKDVQEISSREAEAGEGYTG
eukprot:SAG31_NODE_1011_length_10382_cov_8.910240_8_plen_54_part_00